MPDDSFVELLVDFAHALRDAGLSIGSGEVTTYCQAMAALDPSDVLDFYWAGRATLVAKHTDIPTYDFVFRQVFLGVRGPDQPAFALTQPKATIAGQAPLQVPETEPQPPGTEREQEARLGLLASEANVLKGKSFVACTPDELLALRRIMTRSGSLRRNGSPGARSRLALVAGLIHGERSGTRCASTATRCSCSGAGANRGCVP